MTARERQTRLMHELINGLAAGLAPPHMVTFGNDPMLLELGSGRPEDVDAWLDRLAPGTRGHMEDEVHGEGIAAWRYYVGLASRVDRDVAVSTVAPVRWPGGGLGGV